MSINAKNIRQGQRVEIAGDGKYAKKQGRYMSLQSLQGKLKYLIKLDNGLEVYVTDPEKELREAN